MSFIRPVTCMALIDPQFLKVARFKFKLFVRVYASDCIAYSCLVHQCINLHQDPHQATSFFDELKDGSSHSRALVL
jgi:hypothetical protein